MSVNSSSSITRTSCIPGMPWTNAVTTGQKWHNATAFSRSLGCHSPCSRGCAAAPCEAAQRPARAAHATAAHRAAGRWGAPGRTLLAPCCCSRWGEGFCARRTGAASNATLMKKGTPAAQPRLREPKGAHSGMGLGSQNSQLMSSFRLAASSSSRCTQKPARTVQAAGLLRAVISRPD